MGNPCNRRSPGPSRSRTSRRRASRPGWSSGCTRCSHRCSQCIRPNRPCRLDHCPRCTRQSRRSPFQPCPAHRAQGRVCDVPPQGQGRPFGREVLGVPSDRDRGQGHLGQGRLPHSVPRMPPEKQQGRTHVQGPDPLHRLPPLIFEDKHRGDTNFRQSGSTLRDVDAHDEVSATGRRL